MAVSDAILMRLLELHPKIIDLSLDRMWRLLDKLGNPQDSLPPVIHIAGTNGKGSVGAILESILLQAGLKVGFYTSPHLVSFTERFRINRELITKDQAASLIREIYEVTSQVFRKFLKNPLKIICYASIKPFGKPF